MDKTKAELFRSSHSFDDWEHEEIRMYLYFIWKIFCVKDVSLIYPVFEQFVCFQLFHSLEAKATFFLALTQHFSFEIALTLAAEFRFGVKVKVIALAMVA